MFHLGEFVLHFAPVAFRKASLYDLKLEMPSAEITARIMDLATTSAAEAPRRLSVLAVLLP